jgi:thiol-disulfide isomerase/thioredoxin
MPAIMALCLALSLIFPVVSAAQDAEPNPLLGEYETLRGDFDQKTKEIKTRDAYKKLREEYRKGLTEFLAKLEKETPDAGGQLELLKGRVFLELDKKEDAARVFDALISKQSPVAPQATFEKVRLLLKKNKYDEALPLFRQVEGKIEKGKNYYWALLDFAFSVEDKAVREEFSRKFIAAVGNDKEYENFKAMVYGSLADFEKERGELKKAVAVLEKALPEFTTEKGKAAINSALKRLKMIGAPAPEIAAETWFNSDPLKLQDLKGKAVVIDFWAPWCSPCRKVIPTLKESFARLGEKGLVVIGITRIYGRYSDDTQNKGSVPADEEKKLIQEFVQRNKIVYPVAVADTEGIFGTYAVRGIPTMFLIDKEGNITDIKVGSGDEAELAKKIEKLLE